MENNSNKNYPFFRFEDLRVYHKALDYIIWVENITNVEHMENKDLNKRFSFSAQNIALNIAEGSSKNKTQFVHHLKIAKSAIRECLVYTTLMFNLDLIDTENNTTSRGQLMEMTKMVGALISSLHRTMSKDEEEDYTE